MEGGLYTHCVPSHDDVDGYELIWQMTVLFFQTVSSFMHPECRQSEEVYSASERSYPLSNLREIENVENDDVNSMLRLSWTI
jgi:hypothetical protein